MDYLLDLDFTKEDINALSTTLPKSVIEKLTMFPDIVRVDYQLLKSVGIKNYKEIFMSHAHMFTMNPERFKAIFDKYDHSDLVRCLEKNGAVIEKL